jgi:ABC-type uncharacterized transport system fused permease/ATPase subunit
MYNEVDRFSENREKIALEAGASDEEAEDSQNYDEVKAYPLPTLFVRCSYAALTL